MVALALSLTASLAWGVGDFAQGTAARRYSPLAILICTRIGAVLALGAVALAFGAPSVGSRWPFALAATVLATTGTIALMRALAIGPMGVTAPLIATSGAVPAVWGLFDGVPGVAVFAGLALAAAGTTLASRSVGVAGQRVDPRGVVFALLAAALIGTNMLLMHEAADRSPISAVLLERSGEVVLVSLALLVAHARRVRLSKPSATGAAPLLVIGAIDAAAITSYAAASLRGSLTVAAILSSLYPLVTVLLARSFHHERLSRLQIAGAALTFAGVAMVAVAGAG
jgi:drug/metabolite transporter (DMT)-like permease